MDRLNAWMIALRSPPADFIASDNERIRINATALLNLIFILWFLLLAVAWSMPDRAFHLNEIHDDISNMHEG